VSVLIDPVANAPVRSAAGLLRQPHELALSTRSDVEIPASRHARSRGADVVQQVGEPAPELGLIQARAFLPLPRLLT